MKRPPKTFQNGAFLPFGTCLELLDAHKAVIAWPTGLSHAEVWNTTFTRVRNTTNKKTATNKSVCSQRRQPDSAYDSHH